MKTTFRKKYIHPVTIISVVDGDTLKVDVDLGHKLYWRSMSLRLDNVDTPELSSPNPLQVTAAASVMKVLARWLQPGTVCLLESSASMDKYGRLSGRISTEAGYMDEMLVGQKLAKEYKGGKKAEWTEDELKAIIDLSERLLADKTQPKKETGVA